MGLGGKVALVTGGTKGIGKATALRLAALGADVAVNYFKSRDAAHETVAQLKNHGVRAAAIRANVGNPEHLDRVFADVKEQFGRLDIFVSNAAAGSLKPALELTVEDWAKSMDINARALLLGAQRAAAQMASGGRIVALTSHGPHRVIPKYAAVGSSKAAIETLVRYLAAELAPRGITVNAVSAGIVDTESLRMFPDYDAMVAGARARTPGRVGTPEDVAPVVAWLCTDEAQWIQGQVIVADGGYSLH